MSKNSEYCRTCAKFSQPLVANLYFLRRYHTERLVLSSKIDTHDQYLKVFTLSPPCTKLTVLTRIIIDIPIDHDRTVFVLEVHHERRGMRVAEVRPRVGPR